VSDIDKVPFIIPGLLLARTLTVLIIMNIHIFRLASGTFISNFCTFPSWKWLSKNNSH